MFGPVPAAWSIARSEKCCRWLRFGRRCVGPSSMLSNNANRAGLRDVTSRWPYQRAGGDGRDVESDCQGGGRSGWQAHGAGVQRAVAELPPGVGAWVVSRGPRAVGLDRAWGLARAAQRDLPLAGDLLGAIRVLHVTSPRTRGSH